MLYKSTKLYSITLKRSFSDLAVPSYNLKFQHLEWVQLLKSHSNLLKGYQNSHYVDIAFNNFTITSYNAKFKS